MIDVISGDGNVLLVVRHKVHGMKLWLHYRSLTHTHTQAHTYTQAHTDRHTHTGTQTHIHTHTHILMQPEKEL